MIRVLDARFVTTAVGEESYPRGAFPEVAFVGRSNVGKSSMINALANRKKLVRVSNTPGRTRTLNFFDVDLDEDDVRTTLRLADLPGYGFAKVSKTERESWEGMITRYLETRQNLKAVVAIVDAEVGPTEDDIRTLAYLRSSSAEVLVAATKIDRLPKAKRKPALGQVAQTLRVAREAVIAFSAVEKIGIPEIWRALKTAAEAAPS